MKYWEFLIQKEGDQTWLPLETQQVEILEGRYRVVAHSDRANTAMEIRVSQLITDELPPRQRVRKRVAQTNEAGLVVVMPFVNLKPGRWELTCSSFTAIDDDAINSGDIAALSNAGWQYSVQLQVFAHTEEDWSGEWPVPEDAETVASSLIDPDENGHPVDLALVNEDLPLLQAQAELETRLQSQGIHSDSVWGVTDDFSYQVSLRQQAYLARHDQPMTIMGKVHARSERVLEKTSQLWIRLQNPETAQVIMEAHRPLSLARLPADFKVQIQLPAEVTTRVILGEVSLRTAALPDEKVEVLASTAFTITAGIAQLLDTIANQDLGAFEEEISVLVGAASVSAKEPALIDPSLSVSALPPIQASFVPAVGVVLPPLLDLSELQSAIGNGQQPELPTFSTPFSGPPFSTPLDTAANLIVTDGPSDRDPAYDVDAAVVSDAPVADHSMQSQSVQLPTEPTVALPIESPPSMMPPLERAPMVSNPAQFLGSSIEDGDLEADEIAAVLEDIDYDLRSEASDLDALEPPGIEGALPNRLAFTEPAARAQESSPQRTVPQRTASQRTEPQRTALENPLEKLSTDWRSRRQFHGASAAASAASDSSTAAADLNPERRQSTQQVEASIDFQALKLKDHFWNRLSNLTHESHKEATQISKRMRDAGVTRGQSSILSAVSGFDQDNEVVIYDEPPAAAYKPSQVPSADRGDRRSGSFTPSSPAGLPSTRLGRPVPQRAIAQPVSATNGTAQPPTQSRPIIAPEDLPEMPLPVISVPMGDLVAGEIITVTVRTRPAVFKPFIKLWMIDRQSRSLVIEPQLLTNLIPDALGDLEATTEMQIPMDCLDVQIAAIAVDMATQQESSKAIVNRHVIPANQASSTQGFRF